MEVVKRLTRTEQREKNRTDLIRAARELVVTEGVAAAQLDAVAARVGLTKGAVYSIFGSKLDLLLAVVEDHLQTQAGVWVTPSARDAEGVLQALVDSYLAVLQDPEARQLMLLEVELTSLALRTPELMALLTDLRETRLGELAQALASLPRRDGRAVARTDADEIVRTAVAMLQGVLQQTMATPWTPRRGQVQEAVRALLPR